MSSSWSLSISPVEFARINRHLRHFFRTHARRHDPQDLISETWLDVARYFRGKCALEGFAFIVARSKLIGARRRAARRPILQSVTVESEEDDRFPEVTELSPESVLMLAATHEVTIRALGQLTDVYAEVVALWLRGRDGVQIAEELSISYNTTRSRLRRGKAQLLEILRDEFGV